MTFETFAHGIMDNCDIPRNACHKRIGGEVYCTLEPGHEGYCSHRYSETESGRELTLRERLNLAGFSFTGMLGFWLYCQQERQFYYGVAA